MPTAARLDDGFPTLLSFSASASSTYLWEKEVTPPGISGGGANDITTMRNNAWRTFANKKLKTLTPMSLTAAYDPRVLVDILSMLQKIQAVTVHFPDGSTYTFQGWIDEFKPGAIKEGEQPTAEVVIIPSNMNSLQVETAPTYIA